MSAGNPGGAGFERPGNRGSLFGQTLLHVSFTRAFVQLSDGAKTEVGRLLGATAEWPDLPMRSNLARQIWTVRDAKVASPEGLEPPTSDLEGRCSIQLSYGLRIWQRTRGGRAGVCDTTARSPCWDRYRINELDGRGGGIRTRDLLVPNQHQNLVSARPRPESL